jgi:hypothetical protein
MNNSHISLRGVGVGVIASFALMGLFMGLAAAFDEFRVVSGAGINRSVVFWLFTFVAWTTSLSIGSFWAAVIGKAVTARDGMLTGFAVWAGAFFIRWMLIAAFSHRLFARQFFATSPLIIWLAFFASLGSLGAALYFGGRGALNEAESEEREARAQTPPLTPAFQP